MTNSRLHLSAICTLLALAFLAGATHLQAQVVFDNGLVNTTSATFSDWVVVDNEDFTDPDTDTTLIVNTGAQFNGVGPGGSPFSDTSLAIFATSHLQFNDGAVLQDLDFYEFATGEINGGLFQDDIWLFDSTSIIFNGGSLADDIETYNDSFALITGGTFNEDIEAFDDSQIQITGGNLGASLRVEDDAVITVFGSNFTLNGNPVSGAITATSGTLAGTLLDGTAFSTSIEQNGGGTHTIVVAVPEPATGALLIGAISLLALRRRR